MSLGECVGAGIKENSTKLGNITSAWFEIQVRDKFNWGKKTLPETLDVSVVNPV